jgi:ATP-binding cassette subfamily B protein
MTMLLDTTASPPGVKLNREARSKGTHMAGARPTAIKAPTLLGLLVGYQAWIGALIVVTVISSGLGLFVPHVIARVIDHLNGDALNASTTLWGLLGLMASLFVINTLQIVIQTFASEAVAKGLRSHLASKIASLDYATVDAHSPAMLLTNFTADVDAIKAFVSQVIGPLSSSVFLIVGVSIILLHLDWRLAAAVLPVLGLIACIFHLLLGRVRGLFGQVYFLIDKLNTVINENIIGAPLIRLINSQSREVERFTTLNEQARTLNIRILGHFASMIPIITFLANAATLIILTLGGGFVIGGRMTLGDFTAFNAYLAIMIFPLIVVGLISTNIAQAQASLARITPLLLASPPPQAGERTGPLTGAIEIRNLSLSYGARRVLGPLSFSIAAGTRTAIIGPTAAGKSHLIHLLTGLLPSRNEVIYDEIPIEDYTRDAIHDQIGIVFQDSAIFSMSIRENIFFGRSLEEYDTDKILQTSELADFIESLPNGLDTFVSERGLTLSGGQKQRIMLARALAMKPRILFLDDFTARVDSATEQNIMSNLETNYPDLTLISISQKILPVRDYDQIILLMQGEILAMGCHEDLQRSSPEYVQILQSQTSTEGLEAEKGPDIFRPQGQGAEVA